MAATIAATMFCFAARARAAAHVPARDDIVLATLPPLLLAMRTAPAPQADTARAWRDAVAAARGYIEAGRSSSDPRAYGYAQAALGPWWSADPAPPEVLVTRARILQFRHEFAAALTQLEAALRADPFAADAWLLTASIAQTQGHAQAARSACLNLLRLADGLVGATCSAANAALEGRGEQGQALLERALNVPSAVTPAQRAWAWTVLGEIRAQRGAAAPAEAALREALRLSPGEVYPLAALADLLLDGGRAGEVRALLGDATRADALLLRAAIAAKRSGDADAAQLRTMLGERFAETRARDDATHLREEARFALEVDGDAARALELAQRNFATQKEYADARLLLAAAQAAGDASAAQPALAWLRRDTAKPTP
ncbi:MAG: hypothetical protein JSS16_11630 [Proteobacteria bacterium]|nr:hypothetical protein [Pseudomonadota bacterium]